MAENINRELEKVGYNNINVDIRPNLAVLRRTKMPAVLVEAGFINSDKDNELFDNKFNETARAIADGINETIKDAGLASAGDAYMSVFADEMDMQQNDSPPNNDYDEMRENETSDYYQILVGLFRSFSNLSDEQVGK